MKEIWRISKRGESFYFFVLFGDKENIVIGYCIMNKIFINKVIVLFMVFWGKID